MVAKPMTLQTPIAVLPEMAELVTALAGTEPYDLPGLLSLRQQARHMLDRVSGQAESRPSLTPREQDALDILKQKCGKHRRPVTTIAVASNLLVADQWAWRLLANLREKGYAQRIGSRKSGGWVYL